MALLDQNTLLKVKQLENIGWTVDPIRVEDCSKNDYLKSASKVMLVAWSDIIPEFEYLLYFQPDAFVPNTTMTDTIQRSLLACYVMEPFDNTQWYYSITTMHLRAGKIWLSYKWERAISSSRAVREIQKMHYNNIANLSYVIPNYKEILNEITKIINTQTGGTLLEL